MSRSKIYVYKNIESIKILKFCNFNLDTSSYIAKIQSLSKNQAILKSPFSNLAIKTKYTPKKLKDILYWPKARIL